MNLRLAYPLGPREARQPASIANGDRPPPEIALLSLFDGVGMARIATDMMLKALGGSLTAAAFAELQDDLAAAGVCCGRGRAGRGVSGGPWRSSASPCPLPGPTAQQHST